MTATARPTKKDLDLLYRRITDETSANLSDVMGRVADNFSKLESDVSVLKKGQRRLESKLDTLETKVDAIFALLSQKT